MSSSFISVSKSTSCDGVRIVGGDITSTFDAPEATKLGHCKLIEEIMIGEDRLIHFSGVEKAEACTIVLRGASECFQTSSASV